MTDVASNTSTTFNLDGVTANVYYSYTDPTLANNGPCEWAATQGTAAKTAGIEIFTIGFGVEGQTCSSDNSGSSFYNALAIGLLAAVATNSIDDGGASARDVSPPHSKMARTPTATTSSARPKGIA